MKVFLATDHSGLELKEALKHALTEAGYQVDDCGAYSFDEADDYPDFISLAAQEVAKDPENRRGIVIGGSGQGEAMVANKIKGVRCALFYAPAIPSHVIDVSGKTSTDPLEMLTLIREHNNANMLSLGARFLKTEEAIQAVKRFLAAPFPGEARHARRIEKITRIEEGQADA